MENAYRIQAGLAALQIMTAQLQDLANDFRGLHARHPEDSVYKYCHDNAQAQQAAMARGIAEVVEAMADWCNDRDVVFEEDENIVGPLVEAALAGGTYYGDRPGTFDLIAHLHRQRQFSQHTFGPGNRWKGVLDHIRKELDEIAKDPADLSEWVDVILLALDGAWRQGHEPEAIAAAIQAKQTNNEARTWPDWRTMPADQAIEHDRTSEDPTP